MWTVVPRHKIVEAREFKRFRMAAISPWNIPNKTGCNLSCLSPLCGESNAPASARVGGSGRRVGRHCFERAQL